VLIGGQGIMGIYLALREHLPNETFLSSDMRHSAGQKFIIEYLGEFETEIENILGCLSGAYR
jgi:hypothetical protein